MSRSNRVSQIAGDPDLFECFYREHIEQVRRFVSRRVGDAHLAADLTSEIFLAAIDSAPGYRPERGSPSAWLHGIARKVVADEVRRQVRELRAVRRVSGRRLLDPESQARIEERIDAERALRRMYESLQELTEAERAVLELVAIDGLDLTEAAAALGLRPSTARVRLHRARKRLRQHLASLDTSIDPAQPQEATP